jgi:hypothetical protein
MRVGEHLGIAAAVFVLCVSCGADDSAEDSGPGLYERCDSYAQPDRCREGVCETYSYQHFGNAVCHPPCASDAECANLDDGTATMCIEGLCVARTCSEDYGSIALVCVGGQYSRCEDTPDPPCSVCGCLESEYCSEAGCVPDEPAGASCSSDDECVTGECRDLGYTDGYICVLPTGTPCSDSAACRCESGVCAQYCDWSVNYPCPAGYECMSTALNMGSSGNCLLPCDPATTGECSDGLVCGEYDPWRGWYACIGG